MNVREGATRVHPSPTPNSSIIKSIAAVVLETATANLRKEISARRFSNKSTIGPQGAMYPVSKASITAFLSGAPTYGGERNILFFMGP